MSMASDEFSVPPQMKYEVFVNFRGKDTRDNFTSHLKEALDRNGINAFTDTGLEAGEEISATLDSKISKSLASVVVFSPNYADSRWCLDELVQIMDCKEANGQIVMPVFVQGVEPTHVRKQKGAFGYGFGKLIKDTRYADRKASWKRALNEAADLAGHATDQMSEGEIVKKLINRVQSVLSKMSSIVLDKRFIVMKHVEIVESSMFASEQQWRCLGLWGMGGLGKTTLAKEIEKRVSNHFEGSCFVEKVGELAGRGELNSVYWKQMSRLFKMNDEIQDVPTIQRKLRITKVLIVLDDVSDADQCQELIGDWSLHCPGSKMIAISRDKQILKNIGCCPIYEVKALDDHESLQLLKHHILKQREPTLDQVELLKDAIKYTGGLPLALVVLGRNLFDKDITIWKSELVKLGEKPNLHITKILRTSFDGLDEDEKNIFLDIACFMKDFFRWQKDRVESILNASGFHAISGIDRLVDKALVSISNQKIQMHDLLQQMGEDIASDSRLCGEKKIADTLNRSQGRKMKRKIEVMSMYVYGDTSLKLSPEFFKEMTRLRVLCFELSHNGNNTRRSNAISFTEGLKYLPGGLRYLKWDQYPEQSLPPRFNPVNLVELWMEDSNLRQLWSGEIEPCLPSLKHVDLSRSWNLTMIPNFRNSLKLETLRLRSCENLKDVPDLSQLTKLVELNLAFCSKFRILRKLPPSLIKLNLSYTKIKKLENTSVQGLSQLERLALKGCEELESLPDNICVLKNLGVLDLERCRKLSTLPSLQMPIIIIQGGNSPSENVPAVKDGLTSLRRLYFPGYKGETLPYLKSLVSLGELSLQGSNVKSLPEDIKYLTNLWMIDVSNCRSLSCIPELPPNLLHLDASGCSSLQEYTPLSYVEFDLSQIDIYEEYRSYLHMMFRNCVNLTKEARNVIWGDFRLRNHSIIISLLQTGHDKYPWLCPIGACIPGNEVPEWFKYSDAGPSIQVNINRLHPNGFYFFVVIDAPTNCNGPMHSLTVTCKGYGEPGETFDSSSEFYFGLNEIHMKLQSEHTIVWYHHLGLDNDQFYLNGATFHFFAKIHCWAEDRDYGRGDIERDGSSVVEHVEIEKCGVMSFYFNDDEGAINHGYDDGNDDHEDEDYNNKGRRWFVTCC